MWFVGLLIGLVVGALVHGGEGAFLGAALGTAAGMFYSISRRDSSASALEGRIRALENAVAALQGQRAVAPERAAEPFSTTAPRPVEPEPSEPLLADEPEPTYAEREPTPAAARAETGAASSRPPLLPPAIFWDWFWKWWTGGNALVRVGVVVLFFGVAFLLKYAYEHSHLPIEARLTAIALGGAVMAAIGWRLRSTKPVYALAMQGGGIGVLYLTAFGAFRLFGVLPAEAAFFLLLALAVFSVVLAVLQDSLSLAILAVSGGFLAPVLASTGQGSHVMLFSYYAVLNLGILGIAVYKAWRPLNVLGFLFTFGIGTLWGARFYRPELLGTTEPFLVLFFLMYVAIAVIFAFRQAPQLKHYLDATVLFGTPLVGFGLQTQLMRETEYGAAWSALAVAALYLALAAILYRRKRETLRMLVEAFLALGVIFVTLAIPLALDGRWTSGAWALEGAAAYWVGVRQGRRLVRAFGLLLQLAAGIAFLSDFNSSYGQVPVLNSYYIGTVLIALAALFSNRTIERHAEHVGPTAMQVAIAVFLWGIAWWVYGGLHEIHSHVPWPERHHAALLFFAGTCGAFSFLFWRGWWIARFPALALPVLMAVMLAIEFASRGSGHPLAGYGALAWPLAFIAHWLILRRDDMVRELQAERQIPELSYLSFAHAAGVWLLAAALAWEVAWQINRAVAGSGVWSLIAWGLAPAALLLGLAYATGRIAWPLRRYPDAYLWYGAGLVAGYLLVWSLFFNVSSEGDPTPLPYFPLLNPLDVTQLFVLAALTSWWRALTEHGVEDARSISRFWSWGFFGAVVFVWLNGVLLRTLHHWSGMPYNLESIARSDLAQASLSVFWTAVALACMFVATRRAYRVLWLAGAGLMAVVVLKLFILDLSKIGGVERIVSFIAVGVLMLVIGYVAPVPPRTASLQK
jgi:uncharacterized membrane protein